MPVIVTLRMEGDAAKLEEHAAANADAMKAIVETAKGHGLIAHRFYGSDDGQLMVVDEWPDLESFQKFFGESEAEIGPLMQAAGVAGPPHVQTWRKLETHDEYGWDD